MSQKDFQIFLEFPRSIRKIIPKFLRIILPKFTPVYLKFLQ